MAQHCKGPKLCHLPIYPSSYQQGCSTGLGFLHRTCCWDQDSPWSALGIRGGGRSWCQQRFALLPVPVLHACSTGLPPDGKAKAPARRNEAATSDGAPVSDEVGFGRQTNSKDLLHYSNETKIFQPIPNAGQSTSLTPGNMSCFSSCFPKNSALEMRDAKPGSSMLLNCRNPKATVGIAELKNP